MTSHYNVCARWVARLGGSTAKELQGSRIIADGDMIFSYGRHFAMGVALRKDGQVVGILQNGDRFSVSTSRHQSELRSAVAGSGIPTVIVPFTALQAAGLDRSTVELVEVSADRIEERHHRTDYVPEGSVWRTLPVSDYVPVPEEVLQAKVDKVNADRMEEWERMHRWARAEATPGFWTRWVAERSVEEYPTEYRLSMIPTYERRVWQQVGTRRALFTSATSNLEIEVVEDQQGQLYTWTTTRHWLGEALIRATVRASKQIKCSGCKGVGWHPSSCAACRTTTWEHDRIGTEAPLCGKAENHRHHWDEDSRRWCGGLVGEPCPNASWVAQEQRRCERCSGGGTRRINKDRTALFLSGFDRNERRPSYFFCELPQSAKGCTTIEQAYEALKPDAVRLAEQMARRVERQGDIFAVALAGVSKRELTKQGARYVKRGPLLGTNHVGTETAYLPDGTTLVRGSLVHAPDFRRPDHARVRLGDGWFVVVKNNVPVSR